MSEPADIPQDVWDAALHWWREGGCSTGDASTYARAILAERGRCAEFADRIAATMKAVPPKTTQDHFISMRMIETMTDIAAAIRKGGE